MMDNKEFDRLLRQKFDREALNTSPGSWEQLAKRLPDVPKRKKLLYYYKVAASILILLGLTVGAVTLWNIDFDTQEEQPYSPSLVQMGKHADPAQQNQTMSKQVKPKVGSTRAAASPQIFDAEEDQAVIPEGNKPAPALAEALAGREKEERNVSNTINQINNEDGISKEHQPSVVQNKLRTPATSLNTRPYNQQALNEETQLYNATSDDLNTRGTSIALGGGMNYGSLNTGYTLGLSARQSLGKRLFVEGAVAFLYNNQTSGASNYFGPPTTPSRPDTYTPSNATSPAMNTISDFYYLQINPSVGYQINDLLAISAGADLQQRIASMSQDGTAIFAPNSNNPRIIPQLDFGLTGKTEFFISPKVEAGILYRDGLNNLLQAQDLHPYLNRRYIQVQLKYRLLLH